jgi:hypothetical protein
MTEVPPTTKPTPSEIWVGKGRYIKVVEDQLKAIGEEYNYDVWYNGEKIHSAVEEEADDDPKSR